MSCRRALLVVATILLFTATASSMPLTQALSPTPSQSPVEAVIGCSVKGAPIRSQTFGHGGTVTLLMAGFHGDEPSGVALLERFRDDLEAHPEWTLDRTVVVVPVVNPDGLALGTRANARGVDLNRNFPTRNWKRATGGPRPASEPETRAVLRLLRDLAPGRIVSIHAPLGEVNYDGPAAAMARSIALASGFPSTDDIGYPTPGSFGTYAGKERRIPTITLELETAEEAAPSEQHRAALLAALFFAD